MFILQGNKLGENEVEVVEAYLQTKNISEKKLKEILSDLWRVHRAAGKPVEMNTWLQNTQQAFALHILTDAVEIIFGDGEEGSGEGEQYSDEQMDTDEQVPSLTLTSFKKTPRPGSPDPYKQQEKPEDTPLSRADKKRFLEQWSAHLQEYRDHLPKQASEKRKQEIQNSEPDERHLARLAWLLDKLNAHRVCVAILLTSDHTFYIYANGMNNDLAGDMQRLILATKDPQAYTKLKEDVVQATLSELRGQKGSQEKKRAKARRRLNKALRFLQKFDNPKFQIHKPLTANKHAEMRAADAAQGSGSIGISKLCCGKCTMALTALTGVKGIRFEVLGTHLKTYDTDAGWPVPDFLSMDGAMQLFLGANAYTIYQLHPSACQQLIVDEPLTLTTRKAFKETDIVSSQESQSSLSFGSQQSQDFVMDLDTAVQEQKEEDDEDDGYDNEDEAGSQDLFEETKMRV
ncbi:MAG TPA: hypothetical protein VGF67_16745 [Ktedonobacteraceae bacterium]